MNVAYEGKGKQASNNLFNSFENDGWGNHDNFPSGGNKGNHFGAHFDGNLGGNSGAYHIIKGGHNGGNVGNGGRYVVSKSTSTKTSICNGVKKTVKVTKMKYSDGTE